MDLYLNNLSSYDTMQNSTAMVPTPMNENIAFLPGKKDYGNYCRLCLNEIHDSNVTLLDGIIKDMLEIILPELNLSICVTSSICKGCLETLKQSYSFKSSCLEIEDKVQDFVDPKKQSLVDLKEVLKNTNDVKKVSGNFIVCRTCLTLGEESLYTKLCSYEGDPLQNMVEKCLPEMGLELTKDPVICPMCLEQLEEQFHFIMQCLDTEAKINFYSEKKRVFKDIDLQNVYLFSICMEETDDLEKQYGTTENLENGNCDRVQMLKLEEDTFTKSHFSLDKSVHNNIKKENADADFVDLTADLFAPHIKSKTEPFEVASANKAQPKLEPFNTHSFAQASVKEIKPTEEITFQISKDTNGEDIITSQTSRLRQEDSDSDISVTRESDLLEVSKVTSARLGYRKGQQINRQPKPKPVRKYDEDEEEKSEEEVTKKRTRTRKCKICFFKTKFSSRMKAHMTVYHSALKVATDDGDKYLKCRRCPFKTSDEAEYANHKSQHRKEKEQKCPKCSMVFVRPDFLKKHIENHGTLKPNNVPSYKRLKLTDVSGSKKAKPIKQMTSFNMARPKNMRNTFNFNGQVLKMFRCRLCPYQTRLKSNYEKHALTHKKTSEIKTHRCNICNFETIQKENFLTHMQSHENEGENKVMRCFLCSYQPSSEAALKQHVNQAHKSGTG